MASSSTIFSVDTINPDFAQHRALIKLPHDLMGGTRAMKNAGEAYIAKGQDEPTEEYLKRIKQNVLLNVYKRTVLFLRGQVFQKDPSISEDYNDDGDYFKEFVEDVDLTGRNLGAWGGLSFQNGIVDGMTFTVVDYPRVEIINNNGVPSVLNNNGEVVPKTKALDVENKERPYFVDVPAKSVISAIRESINGVLIFTHFRYIEKFEITDFSINRFGTISQERIYAWWRDRWEVYVRNEGDSWSSEPTYSGENKLGVVPVSIFAPGSEITNVTYKPALDDLSELNRRHWQASASHIALMNYVRNPVWLGLGLETHGQKGPKIFFGPGAMIHSENVQGSLQNIGVDSSSVAASKQELDDLKENMSLYGLQILQPAVGNITATESSKRSEENNSTLKEWASLFKDHIENLFVIVNKYRNPANDEGPGVVINTSFKTILDFDTIQSMLHDETISEESARELYKASGYLPDDFDLAREKIRLEKERKEKINLDDYDGDEDEEEATRRITESMNTNITAVQ